MYIIALELPFYVIFDYSTYCNYLLALMCTKFCSGKFMTVINLTTINRSLLQVSSKTKSI